jgi:hypothetical protein
MKRYEFEQCCLLGDYRPVPHPEGEWVRYEDVKKEFDKYRIEYSLCEDTVAELQEVNKEVLELLLELQNIVFLSRNNELHTQIYKAIAKMREK